MVSTMCLSLIHIFCDLGQALQEHVLRHKALLGGVGVRACLLYTSGTHGHIAIGCNNVDRAIYHLSQRGVKFDLDSKVVKNGKTIACYFADEIAGFAFHLVQA